MEQIAQWDREFFLYLNQLNEGGADVFWLLVTRIETWVPLYLLFFVLFWKTLSRKKALIATIFTFAVMGTILGLTALVKSAVQRLRPSNNPELANLVRVLQENADFSFWSGHSATSFAITVFVALVLKTHYKWIWLLFVWPLLFALSRIFVGVHYPGDLFVGAFTGIVIGYIGFRFWKLIIKK